MLRPSEWFGPVAEIVERLDIRWALAGALAADGYRLTARLTTDADIYSEWHPALVRSLEDAGYEVKAMTDEAVGHPHLLICRRDEQRIDILIPTVEYQEVALERAQNEHVLTVEDVLIHKLLAWRPRDIDDIASILAARHQLDDAYLEHWIDEWDVRGRWEEAKRAR